MGSYRMSEPEVDVRTLLAQRVYALALGYEGVDVLREMLAVVVPRVSDDVVGDAGP